MIREKSPGVDGKPGAWDEGFESGDEVGAIGIRVEDARPLDAPHHHMVQSPRGIQSRVARHDDGQIAGYDIQCNVLKTPSIGNLPVAVVSIGVSFWTVTALVQTPLSSFKREYLVTEDNDAICARKLRTGNESYVRLSGFSPVTSIHVDGRFGHATLKSVEEIQRCRLGY